MSVASSPSPSVDDNPAAEIARLKRQLASAQEDLNVVTGKKPHKRSTVITLGRGVRRIVTMFEPLENLIDEADARYQDSRQAAARSNDAEEQRNNDRTFMAYKLLLRLIPCLQEVIEDPENDDTLDQYIAQLQKGANDARSDDIRRIKEELAIWINRDLSPTPALELRSRHDRGLQNNTVGALLCPIEYNWSDEKIRADIRGGTIDISDNYFITCLYPKDSGDPEDFEKHYLRSALLVKTYCAIFTSPSSSEAFEDEKEDGPCRKKQKTMSQKKATKSNVATLLRMEGKVTPRTIAYAAVLLIFNLTSAAQWTEEYNGFSFPAFYNFIVDFFEETPGARAKGRVEKLLAWWTKQVFPHHVATTSNSRKSRNKLALQRAAHENAVLV